MTVKRNRFVSDSRGSVAIITAVSLVALMGFSALAVDVGFFYFKRRELQTYTDLAAIAAVENLNQPQQAAASQLGLNGFPAQTLQSVTPGVYSASASTPAARRFQAGSTGANAVKVTTQLIAPTFFGSALEALAIGAIQSSKASQAGGGGVTIGAQATAMQQNYASLAIGSSLLTVNGGILNSLLGSMLGANISLSAMSYQSLISTNIDMFAFSNALATRANLTGVTYNSLANSNVTAGQMFAAMVDAAQASPNSNSTAVGALAQIAGVEGVASQTMQLNPLINFGPYAQSTVGAQGLIGASVSALDLVSAVAQIANGQHQIQSALNVNLPGIASATLQLTIGERPVGVSWVSVGAAGASVHTAQTRLLLMVNLVGSGAASVINLPIYLEIASGTATLNAIQCASPISGSSATLGVTPGIVNAWIGSVSPSLMSNYAVEPSPGPATLVNLPPIVVTGYASASLADLSPAPVTFSYAQILAATKQTTSTTDFISSLVSGLIGALQLNVSGVALPSLLLQPVASSVAAAASPIDQILASVLGTLGVGLGNADTWVTGLNCNHAVLVN